MEGLRIFFRKHQILDINNDNAEVIVDCGAIASYVPGTTDQTWYEMTDFTDGLEKLQITWNENKGATNETGSNYEKGISLSLTFFADAFQFIWDFLLESRCGMLNSIDVRIDDMVCKKSYSLFEIKCDNIDFKPEDGCMLEVQLREQDLTWHCVHKTFIWDDWNGFMSSAQHPCFLTGVQPMPRLVQSVRMGLLIFYHGNPFVAAVDWFTANNILNDGRRILNLDNFIPSPLIRDYIDNVAGKCGMTTNTIFHREGTPEYNACIFHPLSGKAYENDGKNVLSPSLQFIPDNRWDITLAELLDKLKLLYAAEWYISADNILSFLPKAELDLMSPIFDFVGSVYPIRNLDYSFSGTKKAAYGRYQYSPDASDMATQEIAPLYNDITDYDGGAFNPMLEGEKTKIFSFAPTGFIRDGKTKDYIQLLIDDGKIIGWIILAVFAVISATAIAGTLSAGMGIAVILAAGSWATNISNKAIELNREFRYDNTVYTGAVRMEMSNTSTEPRILIWDGVNRARAKVVKRTSAMLPTPNPYYNAALVPYNVKNSIGINNPNNVFNYPVYFDSDFEDNMFDRFHDAVDNPLKSLETNQSFKFDTDLCCEMLDIFGLWSDQTPKIGYLVKIENRKNYGVYGRIRNLEIDYEKYTLTISGIVIKQ